MPDYPKNLAEAQQTARAIAREFGNLECAPCARKIIRALGPGLDVAVVRLHTSDDSDVIGLESQDLQVSQSGHHVGVRVGNQVFDNHHPDGVPRRRKSRTDLAVSRQVRNRQIMKILDVLAEIRARPGITLGRKSVQTLYAFLTGFAFARREMDDADGRQFLAGFNNWVRERYKVKSSQGWAKIIAFHCVDESEKLPLFWKLLDEYVSGSRLNGDRARRKKKKADASE